MSRIKFEIKYKYLQLKNFFKNSLPWFIAWIMPRKIALYCFVRVYSILGTCGDDYSNAYKLWEQGVGR